MRQRNRGFNFAEVLFAIMILAIGFIMIAGIFPVGAVQVRLTMDESTGASIARGGANYLEQLANNLNMPATGVPAQGPKPAGVTLEGSEVRALDANLQVRGGLMLGADSRYAYIPFYRRSGTRVNIGDPPAANWSQVAQVYMVPVAVRNRSQFDKGIPPTIQGANGIATLMANVIDAKDPGNTAGVDVIDFPAPAGADFTANTNPNVSAVGEGAYVIIAGAEAAPAGSLVSDPRGEQARVGHIFRIGTPVAGQPEPPRRFELVPGNDYTPLAVDRDGDGSAEFTPLTLAKVRVFVVGRSLADPSQGYTPGTNERDGTSLDIAAYTTFVNVK